jgi:hypothetical protein
LGNCKLFSLPSTGRHTLIADCCTVAPLNAGTISTVTALSFWIKGDLPTALAAEGQFFVETLVLAVLTGLTWAAVTPMIDKDGPAVSLAR